MENIKVMIEIPSNWIDVESPILWVGRSVKDSVESKLKDAFVEQYLTNITLPEIKISPEEIKDRMLQILAERALEK